MARIRSVHPSLFTDEAWVSCSPLARILYIGLWTDADDQGLFEWKPLQIKMRLLPGDAGDVAAMLDELLSCGLVGRFDTGGRCYGAVKDFRLYQRPKKPNAVHPLPQEWRTFVGLGAQQAEPANDEGPSVPHQFPTGSENPPQMEDGGEDVGKDVSSEDKSSDAVRVVVDHDRDAWNQAVTLLTGQGGMKAEKARPFFGRLLRDNGLEARDLLPSISKATVSGTQDPQGYLTRAAQAVAKRRAEPTKPKRVGWV
jgi:hypothetical protein